MSKKEDNQKVKETNKPTNNITSDDSSPLKEHGKLYALVRVSNVSKVEKIESHECIQSPQSGYKGE